MHDPARVTIRRATAADRDAVLRIAAQAMREYALVPDFDGLDVDLGRIGTNHPGTVTEQVAVLDGEVTGSIVITTRVVGTGAGKLTGFYLSPSSRGRGVGRALLGAAVEAARSAGIARLDLETWGRMTAAVHLYESTGWTRGEDPPAGSGADRSYWLRLS